MDSNAKTWGQLLRTWTGISENAKVFIVTDTVQLAIAKSIQESDLDASIVPFSKEESLISVLKTFSSHDLVLVLLSVNTYMHGGANTIFTAFSKPDWLIARCAFVRLDISKESLWEGLSTPKNHVYEKIAERAALRMDAPVTICSKMGTELTMRIHRFATCTHEIMQDGGFAFLPPSETSAEVVEKTANGRIVVDMTIGQLYYFGKLVEWFGLVPSPVTIEVRDGFIVDVFGNEMAALLKEKLFALPMECRKLVELGQGLSDMQPTGLIGVDESIRSSCHFGFGDGWRCGVHLDIVIHDPFMQQVLI